MDKHSAENTLGNAQMQTFIQRQNTGKNLEIASKEVQENLRLSARYGNQSLRHVNSGFYAFIIALFVGVGLLIACVVFAYQGKIDAAIIQAIVGGISEVISICFYRMYNSVNRRMKELDDKNRDESNLERCFSEIEKIDNIDIQDQIRVEIIKKCRGI